MLRKLFFICAVLSLGSILAVAQESSKVDIFGGYQRLHASSGVSGVDGVNFNGWNAALSGYFTRNFGVTADFSGSYAKPNVLGVGVDTKLFTFLFGPTVRVPNAKRITPFGHAYLGEVTVLPGHWGSTSQKRTSRGRPGVDLISP
jgi:hypothetical protein